MSKWARKWESRPRQSKPISAISTASWMCTTNRKRCSRPATSAGFPSVIPGGVRRWLLAALWLPLLAAMALHAHASGAEVPETPGVLDVSSAEATLEPDGLPTQVRRVPLPFRWDHEFPGLG
eukprot:gene7224-9626_t